MIEAVLIQKKATIAFPGWEIRLRGVNKVLFRILNQLVRVAEQLVYQGFLPQIPLTLKKFNDAVKLKKRRPITATA